MLPAWTQEMNATDTYSWSVSHRWKFSVLVFRITLIFQSNRKVDVWGEETEIGLIGLCINRIDWRDFTAYVSRLDILCYRLEQ